MDDSRFIKYATDKGMIDKMGLTIGGATLGNIFAVGVVLSLCALASPTTSKRF